MDLKTRKKRIACPYCSEKILSSAKKCRYCGEWLKEAKQNRFQRRIKKDYFGYIWVISMLIFIGFVTFTDPKADLTDTELAVVPISGVVGFFSFLIFLVHSLNQVLIRDQGWFKRLFRIGLMTVLFFSFFGSLYAISNSRGIYKTGLSEMAKTDDTNCTEDKILCYANGEKKCRTPEECRSLVYDGEESPVTNVINTDITNTNRNTNNNNSNNVECIGPDGKQFFTSLVACTSLNEKWGKTVDYMTNCNIHPDCGGGTEYMPKSQCDLPCSGKPQNSNGNQNNRPTSPSSGLNYYCYDNFYNYYFYTTSGEQCNLDNIISGCRKTYDGIKDMCMNNCTTNANNGSSYCIYNLEEPERSGCLADVNSVHESCLQTCGDEYLANSASCN